MKKLTARQQEIFEFVRNMIETGLPPTIREIGDRFGIKSPNAVACHLAAVEAKGWIKRDPKVSRGIKIVHEGSEIQQAMRKLLAAKNEVSRLLASMYPVGCRVRTPHGIGTIHTIDLHDRIAWVRFPDGRLLREDALELNRTEGEANV